MQPLQVGDLSFRFKRRNKGELGQFLHHYCCQQDEVLWAVETEHAGKTCWWCEQREPNPNRPHARTVTFKTDEYAELQQAVLAYAAEQKASKQHQLRDSVAGQQGLDGSGGAGQPMPALRQHNAYPQTGRMQAQGNKLQERSQALMTSPGTDVSLVWGFTLPLPSDPLSATGLFFGLDDFTSQLSSMQLDADISGQYVEMQGRPAASILPRVYSLSQPGMPARLPLSSMENSMTASCLRSSLSKCSLQGTLPLLAGDVSINLRGPLGNTAGMLAAATEGTISSASPPAVSNSRAPGSRLSMQAVGRQRRESPGALGHPAAAYKQHAIQSALLHSQHAGGFLAQSACVQPANASTEALLTQTLPLALAGGGRPSAPKAASNACGGADRHRPPQKLDAKALRKKLDEMAAANVHPVSTSSAQQDCDSLTAALSACTGSLTAFLQQQHAHAGCSDLNSYEPALFEAPTTADLQLLSQYDPTGICGGTPAWHAAAAHVSISSNSSSASVLAAATAHASRLEAPAAQATLPQLTAQMLQQQQQQQQQQLNSASGAVISGLPMMHAGVSNTPDATADSQTSTHCVQAQMVAVSPPVSAKPPGSPHALARAVCQCIAGEQAALEQTLHSTDDRNALLGPAHTAAAELLEAQCMHSHDAALACSRTSTMPVGATQNSSSSLLSETAPMRAVAAAAATSTLQQAALANSSSCATVVGRSSSYTWTAAAAAGSDGAEIGVCRSVSNVHDMRQTHDNRQHHSFTAEQLLKLQGPHAVVGDRRCATQQFLPQLPQQLPLQPAGCLQSSTAGAAADTVPARMRDPIGSNSSAPSSAAPGSSPCKAGGTSTTPVSAHAAAAQASAPAATRAAHAAGGLPTLQLKSTVQLPQPVCSTNSSSSAAAEVPAGRELAEVHAASRQEAAGEQQDDVKQPRVQAADDGQQRALQEAWFQQQTLRLQKLIAAAEKAGCFLVNGTTYKKLRHVGGGGSCKVYAVMSPANKVFALKRVDMRGKSPTAINSFLREVDILGALRGSAHIVELFDSQVYESCKLQYILLEYAEGDLEQRMDAHADACEAAGLPLWIDKHFIRCNLQQMLQGLHIAHKYRFIHLDLKPANFLVVDGVLKLSDFGISEPICGDTSALELQAPMGTLHYMSPEAIQSGPLNSINIFGKHPMMVRRGSDVWSLGCIIYKMVCGRTPYDDLPRVEFIKAMCGPEPVEMPRDLPSGPLKDMLQRCLNKNPLARITLQDLMQHAFLQLPAAHRPLYDPASAREELRCRQLVKQLEIAAAAGATNLRALAVDLVDDG